MNVPLRKPSQTSVTTPVSTTTNNFLSDINAIKDFQRANGLKPDGIVGNKTLDAINKVGIAVSDPKLYAKNIGSSSSNSKDKYKKDYAYVTKVLNNSNGDITELVKAKKFDPRNPASAAAMTAYIARQNVQPLFKKVDPPLYTGSPEAAKIIENTAETPIVDNSKSYRDIGSDLYAPEHYNGSVENAAIAKDADLRLSQNIIDRDQYNAIMAGLAGRSVTPEPSTPSWWGNIFGQ